MMNKISLHFLETLDLGRNKHSSNTYANKHIIINRNMFSEGEELGSMRTIKKAEHRIDAFALWC